jgi:ribosomal protein L1
MAEAKKAKTGADKKSAVTKKIATAKRAEKKPVAKATAKKVAEKPQKESKSKKSEEAKELKIQAETSKEPAEAANELEEKETTAKAGKRSAKAIKEVEEKQAKEQRKAQKTEAETEADKKPKAQQKPARSKLERRGKNFRKVAGLIEKDKTYSITEALGLAVKTSPVKFDATVEMHIRLGIDPRQADQNLRDTIVLPAGTGRSIRVAVFADPDGVTAAKKAGADIAASDEFLQQLDKGTLDFDILIATPQQMPKLGKYARVLGPKGLMPNPKSGTVTTDVTKAVSEAKAGRVEYRVDSTGIVHLGIGKVSFGDKKLVDNANAVMASVKANKPGSLKGTYIKSIYITTAMGPSIAVTTTEV